MDTSIQLEKKTMDLEFGGLNNMKKDSMVYQLLCEKERLIEIVCDAINDNIQQEDLIALANMTSSINQQWENYKNGIYK
jgi:hypothetical protein